MMALDRAYSKENVRKRGSLGDIPQNCTLLNKNSTYFRL
jgi:hypothetical protein